MLPRDQPGWPPSPRARTTQQTLKPLFLCSSWGWVPLGGRHGPGVQSKRPSQSHQGADVTPAIPLPQIPPIPTRGCYGAGSIVRAEPRLLAAKRWYPRRSSLACLPRGCQSNGRNTTNSPSTQQTVGKHSPLIFSPVGFVLFPPSPTRKLLPSAEERQYSSEAHEACAVPAGAAAPSSRQSGRFWGGARQSRAEPRVRDGLQPLTYLLGAAGEVPVHRRIEVPVRRRIEAAPKPGWPSKVNPSSWAAAVLSQDVGVS